MKVKVEKCMEKRPSAEAARAEMLPAGKARFAGLQMPVCLRVAAESFCVAFSLYSAIPMPRVTWTRENMRYAFCFFPAVGAAVGAAVLLWLRFCLMWGQPVVFAAVAAALPVLLTGGIHIDGFCDTLDALGSHGDADKRLEIMKDSRAGAFAVMGCTLYCLVTFAFWMVFYERPTNAVFFLYILSRGFSGLAVMRFRCAKGSGLAASFATAADKRPVIFFMYVYLLACIICMAVFTPLGALLCAGSAFCLFQFYRERAYRLFGGITGDLAGWFLSLCELLGLMMLVLAQQVWPCG